MARRPEAGRSSNGSDLPIPLAMDVFARAHIGSRAPRLAGDEPLAAIYAGTPEQVARYLVERMIPPPDNLAPLTAELTHLSNVGRAGDSLTLMLGDARMVTVRP